MASERSKALVKAVTPGTLIRNLRGEQAVLDGDLAELYGVETRALTQAVRRNLARFPEDFAFQLSQEEFAALRSQSVISNAGRGGRRSPPYACRGTPYSSR